LRLINKLKLIIKKKGVQYWLWLAVLLGAWELVSRLGLINKFLLPPFSESFVNMFTQIKDGSLGIQALNSLIVILEGMGIALVLAIIITLLWSWSSVLESLFVTLTTVLNPLPAFALMPLIILWFGISTEAMLAIIVHGVLWVLIRQLLDGIRTIPKIYSEWCENIELSAFKKFTGMIFFAVLPDLIVGIRVGWGRAWRALIGAEMIFGMIGALGGLGYYIYNARSYARITNVMSGVIVIEIIGVVFESVLFTQLEKHTIKKWGMIHERS